MNKPEQVWRRIQKFPLYEISNDKLIRFRSTGSLIKQRRDSYPFNAPYKATLLDRNHSHSYEAHVDELYNDAFPEMRGRMAA